MKEALCTAPVLVSLIQISHMLLHTDASGFAIGACLMQDHGNGLQPVAYMSKKLLAAEMIILYIIKNY